MGMATAAYREAVVHTLENKSSNHQMSAALTRYAKFWEGRAGKPIPTSPDHVPFPVGSRKQRITAEDGDGSVEARSKENLPEGWHVHKHRSNETTVGWSSPRRHFYFTKNELDARLG